MRFSIQKDALKAALDVASLAVTNDAGVITSSILFKVEEDSLVLWATDRRIMVKVPTTIVEDSLHGEGSFTVEAARLSQWVGSVFDDVVDVEADANGVVMECGEAKGHFASLDAASFPDFSKRLEDKTKLFDINPNAFVDSLKFVRPFIGEATTNNELANNLQVTELRGRDMLATDTCSLAMFKLAEADEDDALAEYVDSEERFKITKDEIKKLISFLSKTCDLSCTVSKSDLFVVESDDGSLFGYPDTHLALPNIPGIPVDLSEPEVWSVDKTKLQSAVKALGATADPDDVVLEIGVAGPEGAEGVLTLKMKDALEKHDSVVKIPVVRVKSSGESVSLKVNRHFLTNPLSLYDDDEVTIGVSAHDGAQTKYVKLYEKTEDDNIRICLVTLRVDL